MKAAALAFACLILCLSIADAKPRRTPTERPNATARVHAPAEAGYALSGHWLIARARMYVGTNPTGMDRRWCGKFMGMIVGGQYVSDAFYRAAHWLKAGRPGIAAPGALVVYPHHIGVIVRLTGPGKAIIISGNDGPAGGRQVMERERSLAGARGFRYI